MVLCLDKSIDYRLLASGSKDRTARVWASTEEGEWRCVAVCEGHAETVGAIAMSRKLDDKGQGRFMITASQDRTLKMWDLTSISASKSAGASSVKPKSLATLRAHEKDINSLDLSPNDRFLASGSQDKLVKIFEVDFTPSASGPAGALKLVGTCKGHRRGVWTVKFSRTDRIVASGAADRTIKLWSLDDFTCLKVSLFDWRLAGPEALLTSWKTLEGHTNSVLRVDFLSHGMQLVTSASDGLVKLWNVKDEECVKTLDNHEDKVSRSCGE
jgi:U3 small nucleolar RNA-associated protein 13